MIDIERIMQTEIPDIAAVYGGSEAEQCLPDISPTHGIYLWKQVSKE